MLHLLLGGHLALAAVRVAGAGSWHGQEQLHKQIWVLAMSVKHTQELLTLQASMRMQPFKQILPSTLRAGLHKHGMLLWR